jgi:site-specific DNA-methyltransferase (adenine-specific)
MILQKEIIGNCELYLGQMEDIINNIQFVNHVLTDPPYLYIKTHDFDCKFSEKLFFENVNRLLPDNGFIALFGRGTSFYRWNTRLAKMKFKFKEEIIWNKLYTSSPCMAISRVHETISIFTKKTGKIHRVKIPYLEQKQYDIESIINDINRIKSTIKNEDGLNEIIKFLQSGKKIYKEIIRKKNNVTVQPGVGRPERAVSVLDMINNSQKEKSIIKQVNRHYSQQHPTEKPVRLAERIIQLISEPGDIILDPFMGSGSFGIACVNTNRKYIGIEINQKYFDIACERIKKESQPSLF